MFLCKFVKTYFFRYGVEGDYNVMVIDLLGPSLEVHISQKLQKTCKNIKKWMILKIFSCFENVV